MEEGIGELATIFNVSINGVNMAFRGGAEAVKAGARLAKFIKYLLHDRKYLQLGGKTDSKVIGAKFGDVEFRNVRFPLTDEGVINTKYVHAFDSLCKRVGLLYCTMPNYKDDTSAMQVMRIMIGAGQETKINEVVEQLAAMIYKDELKRGKTEAETMEVVNEFKQSMQAVLGLPQYAQTSGMLTCSDERFLTVNQQTFALVDNKADDKVIVEVLPEKKKS